MSPRSRSSIFAPSFATRERLQQAAYFNAELPGKNGYRGADYRLFPENKLLNLMPTIREAACSYFDKYDISWHIHANHGLSSQVCCLNFLMPFAEDPLMLARLIGQALKNRRPEMLEVEPGPDKHAWYVGFEWNGRCDYLNESGHQSKLRRGANSTSTDAMVRFRDGDITETLLIEWKYTESYGSPIKASGNPTRLERYKDLVFAPFGPIRNDLGLTIETFFWEPFYQLLRQQMLAFQMQRAKEDGADRVRLLHIAPSKNIALRKVTSPTLSMFGSDALSVFQSLLVRPDDFVSVSTEDLFDPILPDGATLDARAEYLRQRYAFLSDRTNTRMVFSDHFAICTPSSLDTRDRAAVGGP